MKRKVFDLRGWHRVKRGEQRLYPQTDGVIVDFWALEVVKPFTVTVCGQAVLILESGGHWIRFAQPGAVHAVTVQLNPLKQVCQVYVDVGAASGLTAEGLPWIDDLYLDVIALVDADWQVVTSEVIDQEELEEALASGAVTEAQYQHAWAEAQAIQAELKAQQFAPLQRLRAFVEEH